MELLGVIVILAFVFGLCFLLDKGFTKVFRSQAQHFSGLSVRLSKRYGSVGLLIFCLGVASCFTGSTLMLVCGMVLILVGAGLVTYYMTFGVFYDEKGFVVTTFGKKSRTYRYSQIRAQQLYLTQGGATVIELYFDDKTSVQLQSTMTGTYEFMDRAFESWLQQTGRTKEQCDFYDPDQSCWFPKAEGN